ncbi:cache domain-containing protein [Streptomyces vinaceus]|uniref:cache domain-containing protein n=1 Tax=Streptomyces vinaceus TaxID=1960 RepID=UPI0036C4E114
MRGLLGEVHSRLEVVATELVARRRAALAGTGVFGVRDLAGLKPTLVEQVTSQPAADGCGVLLGAGVISDRERHIEWWRRGDAGFVQLRLNLDPTSVDVYDYFDRDWFAAARDHGRGSAYGPYVDYTGADRYVFTFTVPVSDDIFLGVAGMDLGMTELEPRLLGALRRGTHDAVLVGPERHVIAANTSRWVVGSRLPYMPRAGEGEFLVVGDVGLDSGWVVALAAGE